jgi:hypothetical protein
VVRKYNRAALRLRCSLTKNTSCAGCGSRGLPDGPIWAILPPGRGFQGNSRLPPSYYSAIRIPQFSMGMAVMNMQMPVDMHVHQVVSLQKFLVGQDLLRFSAADDAPLATEDVDRVGDLLDDM